eukprot:5338628-Pleurochrysis_carterae.AAC.1
MHINFGDRYGSSAGAEDRRVTTRNFPCTAHDVVASASAADFDIRPPSPGALIDEGRFSRSESVTTETVIARRAGTPREGLCG